MAFVAAKKAREAFRTASAFSFHDGTPDVTIVKDFTGRGKCTLPDGSWYVGEFREGVRIGYGAYRERSSDEYRGEFADNKFTGYGGCCYLADDWGPNRGDYYLGEWEDGKYNGHGIYYNKNGTIWKAGWWWDGSFIK